MASGVFTVLTPCSFWRSAVLGSNCSELSGLNNYIVTGGHTVQPSQQFVSICLYKFNSVTIGSHSFISLLLFLLQLFFRLCCLKVCLEAQLNVSFTKTVETLLFSTSEVCLKLSKSTMLTTVYECTVLPLFI